MHPAEKPAFETLEDLLDQLPDGDMREALAFQEWGFVRDFVAHYLSLGELDQDEFEASFDHDPQERVRQLKLAAEGTPTVEQLLEWCSED